MYALDARQKEDSMGKREGERESVSERERERERDGGETAIDDPPRVEHIYIGEYIRSMLHTLIVDEDK